MRKGYNKSQREYLIIIGLFETAKITLAYPFSETTVDELEQYRQSFYKHKIWYRK